VARPSASGRARSLCFKPSRLPWLPMERLDRNLLAAVLRPLGSARRALDRVQVSGAVAPHSGRMSANASGALLAIGAEDASRPEPAVRERPLLGRLASHPMASRSTLLTTRVAHVAVAILASLVAGVAAFLVVDVIVVWPKFLLFEDLESSPRLVVWLLQKSLEFPVPPLTAYGILLVSRNAPAQFRVILAAVTVYVSVLCFLSAIDIHSMVGVGIARLFLTDLLRMLPASVVVGVAFLWVFNRRVRSVKSMTDGPAWHE